MIYDNFQVDYFYQNKKEREIFVLLNLKIIEYNCVT